MKNDPQLKVSSILFKAVSISAIVIALVFLIIAHLFPVSDVDAEVSVLQSKGVLKGDLYLYGFDIEAGVQGGFIGGQEIRNERFYVQGPGPGLQERLGILMNSYKDMTYKITAETYDPAQDDVNTAKISVNTHIDRIPFWVEGIKEDITITIYLNETQGVQKVDIKKIWIESWDSFIEDENKYTKNKVIWEKDVSDTLTENEPEIIYKHSIEYVSAKERAGIVVRV